MKKRFLFICIILLFFCFFSADARAVDWTEIYPDGGSGDNWALTAIDDDGSVILAGETDERLYISTNSGSTWSETQPAGDVNKNWYGVAVNSLGSILMTGGNPSRLYISENTGSTWSETQPAGSVDKSWFALASDSTGTNLFACAYNGRCYVSENTGSTWSETQPAGDANKLWWSMSVDSDASVVLVGQSSGRLYLTTNSGSTWSETQPAGDANKHWRWSAMDNDGSVILVGATSGRLYISTNSGSTWSETQPAGDVDKTWLGLASDSTGTNLFACSGERCYISENTGSTWTETQPIGDFDSAWQSGAVSKDFAIGLVADNDPVDGGLWLGSIAQSEDSGTIEIVDPINDETVLGSFFGVEFNYWNYGETSAPYDKVLIQIAKSELEGSDVIYYNWFYIDTDNVEEEKNRIIPTIPEAYLSVLGTYYDSVLTVVLYNSVTGAVSDYVEQTFNIETPGSRNYVFNYPLDFLYHMDYIDGRPSITYNNINDQEIVVSAGIGDISCDDITSGYFDYNSYTDNTFSTIDVSATINRFVKGGLYLDCQFDQVFLYLKAEPENPGPVYYQLDYYDDTGQTNKLNFLRFVIYYDVDNGVTGGVESQDPSQNYFCDDLTFYLPNYLGEPFEINFFNKVCTFIIPPPNYFSNQFDRVIFTFKDKFAFLFQIKTSFDSVKLAIASDTNTAPEMQSGSWNGASFQLSDMFAGSSSFISWFRAFFSVVMWIAFIVWLLKDVKELLATREVGENNF